MLHRAWWLASFCKSLFEALGLSEFGVESFRKHNTDSARRYRYLPAAGSGWSVRGKFRTKAVEVRIDMCIPLDLSGPLDKLHAVCPASLEVGTTPPPARDYLLPE
ncbi:hypothetical protein BDV98DRAFT_563668 [Pterulicium gracile]|uniref:Uncharacterized protein n=1 Tax=Pterulicium gracile TaxID=1884261 RepID=A0A5C3QTI3_9AGAR|nr:hypothetical protein BDV98DRAFT_563668 [Pterula gracilis]